MENKEIINKILEGTQQKTTITINYNGEDFNFTLTPLTSGQLSKLQKLERRGLNINITSKGKTDLTPINAGELADAQAEAMYQGISYSLDAPVDKIKQLPQHITETLFKEVIRISEVTEKELIMIRNFQ